MRVKTLSLLDLGKIAELKPEQSSCNARLVTKTKLTANKKKKKKEALRTKQEDQDVLRKH